MKKVRERDVMTVAASERCYDEVGFEDGRMGLQAQECPQPSKLAGSRKEPIDFLTLVGLSWTFLLWKCKMKACIILGHYANSDF